jgi:hypothetical protein
MGRGIDSRPAARQTTWSARRARSLAAWAAALALWSCADAARAVEPYLFSLGVLGGLGGPLDASDPDPGVDNQVIQLQAGMLTEPRTLVIVRVGRLETDDDAALGSLTAPTLDYLTISGEYRLFEGWYDSGIFLGLGGYRLEGDRDGVVEDETSIGLTLGATGEMEVTRHFSVIAEFSGHWADLDETQLFGMGLIGLAVKF